MLHAGLPATERYPHSLPVIYLPAGYDAAIAGTSKDLKFTNTFSQPLLIDVYKRQTYIWMYLASYLFF